MSKIILFAAALGVALSAHAGGFLDKPDTEPKFLPVDQAFEIQPLEHKDGQLVVSWRIARGYYLYRQRLDFENVGAGKLGKPELPAGDKHHDEYFGEVEVYRQDLLAAKLPLQGAAPKQFKLKVTYQGCAEAGLCYPPQTRVLEAP